MIFQLFATALLAGAAALVLLRGFSWRFLKIGLLTILLLAIYFVWRPDDLTAVANVIGIGRGADLVGYVSTLVLLLFILSNMMHERKVERQLTEIARYLAIRDARRPGDSEPK